MLTDVPKLKKNVDLAFLSTFTLKVKKKKTVTEKQTQSIISDVGDHSQTLTTAKPSLNKQNRSPLHCVIVTVTDIDEIRSTMTDLTVSLTKHYSHINNHYSVINNVLVRNKKLLYRRELL